MQALAAGNLVVVCGTLSFATDPDPACAASAQQRFGAPDQVWQLAYPVHDPKSGQTGQQRYTLMMWTPAGH